jgi:hypothetical protein
MRTDVQIASLLIAFTLCSSPNTPPATKAEAQQDGHEGAEQRDGQEGDPDRRDHGFRGHVGKS